MNKAEAINIFQKILHEYQTIKSPKYRHADYENISKKYEALRAIKKHLQGNKIYHDLLNGVSQTLSKLKKDKALAELSRDQIWSNLSERGMNKTIRPSPKKKFDKENFPIKWMTQGKNECALIDGYWDEKNFIVMEVLGYALLLFLGMDPLPENQEPIFDNLKSIEDREFEFVTPLNPINQNDDHAIETNTATIKNRRIYSIAIDDNHFRRATGLKMSSKEIFNLLDKTSNAKFKLPFPVIVKNSNGKETIHKMNNFSRFFEMNEVVTKVRKDGVVQSRIYEIEFATFLGELFVNNLLSKHNDRVDLRFYRLPANAQLFYRRFLLHINFFTKPLNLETIVNGLGLQDKNKITLTKTIEKNILEPLIRDNLISSYEISQGLKGTKFIIKQDDTCRRM